MKDFISFIEFWVHVIIFKIELKKYKYNNMNPKLNK
jgi:hypothetical protein